HHDIYEKYSKRIRAIYEEYTDKVEPFGIDECWLDITDTVKFFGTPLDVANQLRKRIKDEIGVTISVGISFSKTFAKQGSDMKKPDAVTEISYSNYKNLTYKLPLSSIIGIGRKLEPKLNKLNIYTLGDLANYSKQILKNKFGIVGEQLHDKLNGINDDTVASIDDLTQIKSIGNGTTTLVDIKNINEMCSVVMFLCDEIATRLRKKSLVGCTLSVSLRKNDLTWISKSHTISFSTNNAKDLYQASMDIIKKMWDNYTLIRSVRISISNLQDENSINQLTFFDNKNTNKQKLDKAIDKIRDKYGYKSIKPLITQNEELINSDAIRLDDKD
ncbi:MAG: hypothetical protein J6Q51_00205, partial [Clostridia bacterium]|nr:hypothetical protein [Clostridia bacterium]